jgi:O-antigen ligase
METTLTSHPASDRFLRLSTICLAMLTAIVWMGPFFDWVFGVHTALGRVNNLSMIVAILHFALVLFIPVSMRGKRERQVLLITGALFLYATLISLDRYADWFITFGGLLALFGALSAGFGAYILGKSGKGLHNRLTILMIATLPALAIPPAMIAYDPEAYKTFWANVYGYSNVRVFGYFAAVTTVLLSGLAMGTLRSNPFKITALHFAALAFSWSALFWSGSRAGIVATLLAIVIAWVIAWRKPVGQILFVSGAAGIGVLLSTFYYTPGKWFGLINRVQDTAQRISSGGVASASSNRFDMWQWALQKIMENPLLGHGYLPMADMGDEGFDYFHTHNIVIEYLLSFGLIAGTAMLLLALAVWVRALKAARRIGTPTAMALMMLVIVLPIYAMFSATLFFPFHLMVFMIAMGALIGWDIWEQRPDEPEEAPFKAQADWMFDDLEGA